MASRRPSWALALVALCLSFELALQEKGKGKKEDDNNGGGGGGETLVPAIFVFGDSTVDVGNNNFLPRCNDICRANYPRYGVDYPSQNATGRFSNGYNLADYVAKLLGFPESPPALKSLSDEGIIEQMKKGINYASGGSGLRNHTGHDLCGQVCTMADQLEMFTSNVQKMGKEDSSELISRSLFFISVGSNDLFEYANDSKPRHNRNDTEFLKGLVDLYKSYLQELYEVGARKFSVVSPSLVGCCPIQRVLGNQRNDTDGFGCFGTANNLSRQLYPMMLSMLQNIDLQGMNYSIADSVGMTELVFKGVIPPGMNLTVVDTACCGGSGPLQVDKCNSTATLCPNRDNYLFWDGFHATDVASSGAAKMLCSDEGSFVHPINITKLATL